MAATTTTTPHRAVRLSHLSGLSQHAAHPGSMSRAALTGHSDDVDDDDDTDDNADDDSHSMMIEDGVQYKHSTAPYCTNGRETNLAKTKDLGENGQICLTDARRHRHRFRLVL